MEAELDLTNPWVKAGLALVALILLLLMGRAVTPDGDRLLTWQEWQVRKLQTAYQAEYRALLAETTRLAELLSDGQPNPARAQVVVQSVRRNLASQKVETLATERNQVAQAAQAVLAWASGIGEYNTAVNAVNAALEALER